MSAEDRKLFREARAAEWYAFWAGLPETIMALLALLGIAYLLTF
jgi:hypothetical protein